MNMNHARTPIVETTIGAKKPDSPCVFQCCLFSACLEWWFNIIAVICCVSNLWLSVILFIHLFSVQRGSFSIHVKKFLIIVFLWVFDILFQSFCQLCLFERTQPNNELVTSIHQPDSRKINLRETACEKLNEESMTFKHADTAKWMWKPSLASTLFLASSL